MFKTAIKYLLLTLATSTNQYLYLNVQSVDKDLSKRYFFIARKTINILQTRKHYSAGRESNGLIKISP